MYSNYWRSKKNAVIAVITTALKGYKVTPLIVGGQAVELYTSGGYSTLDIDYSYMKAGEERTTDELNRLKIL